MTTTEYMNLPVSTGPNTVTFDKAARAVIISENVTVPGFSRHRMLVTTLQFPVSPKDQKAFAIDLHARCGSPKSGYEGKFQVWGNIVQAWRKLGLIED